MAASRRTNQPRRKPTVDPVEETPLTPADTPDVVVEAPETGIDELDTTVVVATEPAKADEEAVENATITDAEAKATARKSGRRSPKVVDGNGTHTAVVTAAAFSFRKDDLMVTAFKGDTVTVTAEVFERGLALGALRG